MSDGNADSWQRYKTYNTPTALARLTDSSLKSLGVDEKELRRLTLAAFKKAEWNFTGTDTVGPSEARASAHPKVGDIKSVGSAALPSISGPGGSKPNVRLRFVQFKIGSVIWLTPRTRPGISHRFAWVDIYPETETETEHRGR